MNRVIRPIVATITWFSLCCMAMILAWPGLARADGFIIVHGAPVTPNHFAFAPLEVSFHHVAVDINDAVATTSVDEEFYNPNAMQLEGTYIFPLPRGAHIDKFAMDINGRMVDAELLSADKARALYEEVVRKSRDPALLEYVGRDAFKVRIFPIEANSRKHIKLSYTQLITSDAGVCEYTYPLNTEKFSSSLIKDVSVKISLNCKEAIKSIYSPSHNVEIKREGANRAVIGYEANNVRPDTDFKLIYSRDAREIGVNLLTYRAPGEDGYFLLLASPGDSVRSDAIQPKDVTFILDTSGSMAGPKIDQARKALTFCLANLNDADRFEVIRFSTECEPLFNGLEPATKENVDKAQAFVKKLKPMGATDINDVLEKALAMGTSRSSKETSRPYVVIFLTDGQPTIGETSEDSIVANVAKWGHAATRIFCFGLGTDVNTHLLDRIANDTHAISQYVLPDEDLEVKLSNFYTKVKEPVLTNVCATFSGGSGDNQIRTSELYPGAMPDLFKGQVLVAFGRYSGHGPGAVKITGTLNGQTKEFSSDVTFAENDTTNGYIPRLWATRRVGWLLDQMRLNGESKELKDEIVHLAREHGIVTPYTAYLIMEDEQKRNVPTISQNMRELKADKPVVAQAKAEYDSALREAADASSRSGGQAVANAQNYSQLKYSDNIEQQQYAQRNGLGGMVLGKDQPSAPMAASASPMADQQTSPAKVDEPQNFRQGYRQAQNYAQQARVVKGRAFYQNGDVWTDSTIQANANAKRQKVAFNSDAYFALMQTYPTAVAWLSLGNEIDVMLGGTIYEIR